MFSCLRRSHDDPTDSWKTPTSRARPHADSHHVLALAQGTFHEFFTLALYDHDMKADLCEIVSAESRWMRCLLSSDVKSIQMAAPRLFELWPK